MSNRKRRRTPPLCRQYLALAQTAATSEDRARLFRWCKRGVSGRKAFNPKSADSNRTLGEISPSKTRTTAVPARWPCAMAAN